MTDKVRSSYTNEDVPAHEILRRSNRAWFARLRNHGALLEPSMNAAPSRMSISFKAQNSESASSSLCR